MAIALLSKVGHSAQDNELKITAVSERQEAIPLVQDNAVEARLAKAIAIGIYIYVCICIMYIYVCIIIRMRTQCRKP